MTAPETNEAAPPTRHPRVVKVLSARLTVARAARFIASVTVTITIISGVLIHFTDKKQFSNVGDGLWWAVQTVTTVGYGDLVPTSLAGRLVAAVVMVVGIGFLTVITATITSAFVESTRRRLDGAKTDAVSAKLDQIDTRLAGIEAALKSIRGSDGGTA